MRIKTSDYIAQFLAQRNASPIFTISGAGNLHLLDSFAHTPGLRYICVHHEQAGAMAAVAYRRVSGRTVVMMTTSGGGATNAVTGVLDAWADSIPVLIISGQEKAVYAQTHRNLRMWGVQGVNIVEMVKGITKYAAFVNDPKTVRYHLEKAFHLAESGRPGPVWLDIPIDVQAAPLETDDLVEFIPETPVSPPDYSPSLHQLLEWLKNSKRPVFLLGQGIRLTNAHTQIPALMANYPVAYLTSWNGADLIPADHPLHFGHAGNYGQRCANFVIQNADLLLTIGTRLAIPQVGYSFQEFVRQGKKVIVDIDSHELAKFPASPDTLLIQADAGEFIQNLLEHSSKIDRPQPTEWIEQCQKWQQKYPLVDPAIHKHNPGTINSYDFIQELTKHLGPDEIVVTDMGTALTCTHQSIALTQRQRMVTSTGLGEMGFGLPGAIGACFANQEKRVVLISGDGSMMMNLQELQTVIHHRLPIKIFLFNNNGYLSIRHTEQGLFGKRFSGTGVEDGVSCPNFSRIAQAFGFITFHIQDYDTLGSTIEQVLAVDGPALCEIPMDPMQPLIPKLSFTVRPDGSMVSPPIEDLYPFIPRAELKEQMLIPLDPKSEMISDAD